MIISLEAYQALLDFFDQEDPDMAEVLVAHADGDYHYVLEELNIRKRDEVELDLSFTKDQVLRYMNLAQEILEDYEEEDPAYLSHIDRKLIETSERVLDFFKGLLKEGQA